MSQQEKFDRIVASLHEATLGNADWRETSALIDDACGMKGTHLVVVDGRSPDEPEWLFDEFYCHGEPAEELAREYVADFFPRDERIPRLMRLPHGRVVHITDLYTGPELKNSPTYNDLLRRTSARDGLNIRMDGADGLHIVWALADSIEPDGWRSDQIEMIERLLPHIRQFVRVRQALAGAEALGGPLVDLLDNTLVGVVYLDRRGMIVETNARAREILRQDNGLSDRGGFLRARLAADDDALGRLLARAVPRFGGEAVSGSMTVERSSLLPPASPLVPRLGLHVCPVAADWANFGIGRVAALVLIVDPTAGPRIDSDRVAETLGLTRGESRVAVALAEGRTVRDIATATHRAESSVRWLVKRIHAKLDISRQADLVRMVLSIAKIQEPRR